MVAKCVGKFDETFDETFCAKFGITLSHFRAFVPLNSRPKSASHGILGRRVFIVES